MLGWAILNLIGIGLYFGYDAYLTAKRDRLPSQVIGLPLSELDSRYGGDLGEMQGWPHSFLLRPPDLIDWYLVARVGKDNRVTEADIVGINW